MSKEKQNQKIKDTIEEKIDLLENILASETDIDLLAKVDELNTQYFHTLENLKEARPVFANCDEAFISVAEKLLRNFELAYSLLEAQYRGEIERRIAFLEAVNDRIVPFYWKTKWLHRPRQNYAATLVNMEADEVMKKVFAKKEQEIFEKYLKALDGEQSEDAEKWEVVGELNDEPAGGAEQAESGEESAGAELSKKAEESPQNASESAEQTESGAEVEDPAEGTESAFEVVSDVPLPNEILPAESEDQSPSKKRKKEKKSSKKQKAAKKSSKNASVSDSDRVGQKKDWENAEGLAENAPESTYDELCKKVSEKLFAKVEKDKKGGEGNDNRKGD